ncbi:uncharacterized protein LOC110452366 [Mizuhopecten yessoensis]|uniref:Uncharacterized protein n=1 Tax=Mizuhopecten yessoensis TaxID=6573 RepID=A0A210QJR0_MIZYE|nr:uncharacterized protein LOC110452366 [Mizuhopecten yessoensis]OWF48983.1 hypothetical protein KP79_PYT22992 [Mizuhopecten yessoensis]
MSLNNLLFLFSCIFVAANVEALVFGSRHALYSPRQAILSSAMHDADTVNIGFGGSDRRMSSLSALSNLGLGLGRRSIRPRLSSGQRRGNNIVVLGTGDMDYPSLEYGSSIGSLSGLGSIGGLGGLGSIGGISRIGGLGGYGGDSDHITVPRGTDLRLAARAGLFEDADSINFL